MEFLKKMPATIVMVVLIILTFIITAIGRLENPIEWQFWLLNHGALYAPLTLGGEWYRIFTSMFLHASFLHLAFNCVALALVGGYVEHESGSLRFLIIFFACGFAGALSNLFFGLFTVGVGASGAVFGLLGVAVILIINNRRQDSQFIIFFVMGFFLLLIFNWLLGDVVGADHASHMGGLICGLIMGLIQLFNKKLTVIIAPLLLITYFLLPRFQVHYYNFFQDVLAAQDSTNYVLRNSTKKSDEDFLKEYKLANAKWDSALRLLNAQKYIPEELSSDTFKLRRLLTYHKKEGDYRITMVENESYIYADSINIASDSIGKYNSLQYVLNLKYKPQELPDTTQQPGMEPTKIWYDSNWVELAYPPAEYFRIGYRDSSGLWQGAVADYYKTGIMQMRGSYEDDAKDGIFIYYTDKGMHSAAGVYNNDQRVGKWETFHPNGQIESEVYYRDRYFLKSYWDSLGVQMIKDGYGTETHRYPNGVIASEGKYVDGYQEGYWYGRHDNGAMYFEENYNQGRLINGRSRSKSGGNVVMYDQTTFYALPEGGYKKLNEYLASQSKPQGLGTVRLSFRVTVSGRLTDFKIEKGLSKELDLRAKLLVLAGPRWLPARLHGQEPTDGYGLVSVEF